MPIIDEPYTKPAALEKVVQYPDPRLKEKLESFIPESSLKEAQPRTIVPDPRILEEVPRSALGTLSNRRFRRRRRRDDR